MTDQHGHEVRQAAEEAFVEALHQLEERLLFDEETPAVKPSSAASKARHLSLHGQDTKPSPQSQTGQSTSLTDADLQAFAEAAEEIEQFMQTRH